MKFDRFKVFLYYRDLEGDKHFYREILGLPEHRESDHVWQYQVTADSLIGLVADDHGYLPASYLLSAPVAASYGIVLNR